jgi:hypothetical protein
MTMPKRNAAAMIENRKFGNNHESERQMAHAATRVAANQPSGSHNKSH